jgi:hypothetical protein
VFPLGLEAKWSPQHCLLIVHLNLNGQHYQLGPHISLLRFDDDNIFANTMIGVLWSSLRVPSENGVKEWLRVQSEVLIDSLPGYAHSVGPSPMAIFNFLPNKIWNYINEAVDHGPPIYVIPKLWGVLGSIMLLDIYLQTLKGLRWGTRCLIFILILSLICCHYHS